MKGKPHRHGILLGTLTVMMSLAGTAGVVGGNDHVPLSEYKVKAVYLYNFLQFTRWPEGIAKKEIASPPKDTGQLTIGILGEDPFGRYFDDVDGKVIEASGKTLVIKRFGAYREGLPLTECDLLFISSSERTKFRRILADVNGAPVLTVADTTGFVGHGGMINLLLLEDRIRWEINQYAVQSVDLHISSQLIRVAVRTVTKSDRPKQ